MGTQGTGRKRAPLKDRFSAEDEALSSIAREAEARLAAKRAARAEARDIRMRELERQQKERLPADYQERVAIFRTYCRDKITAPSHITNMDEIPLTFDIPLTHKVEKKGPARWRYAQRGTRSRRSSWFLAATETDRALDDGRRTLLHKDYEAAAATSSSSSTVGTGLSRSYSMASIYDDASLYGSGYNSRAPSEYSWYSSGASSTRSSPVCSSDDDTVSSVSQQRASKGRRDSVSSDFSDISESAADYFSRSNRRGSIVSDLDDLSIPDLDALDEKCDKQYSDYSRPSSRCATPGLSAATLASLGGTSSRRGSTDTGSIYDPDTSLNELRFNPAFLPCPLQDIYELKDQIQDVEGRYMQGLKELKESLAEVEEKYKKAMVSNAQLDNDKANLIYQVDTLKDVIEEMEEQMAEMKRELEEKSKELERQKHTCTVLQHKQEELKEGIRQRDELIEENQRMQTKLDAFTREAFDLQETINWKDKKIGALERQKEYFDCIRKERDELRDELADIKGKAKSAEKHGLVIIPDGTPNGDVNHEPPSSGITVVSQEAAQLLESVGEGPLDVRLRKLAEEKDELLAQIRKLKNQLEEERQKHSKMDSLYTDGERMENGTDLHFIEMQRDANRQISEYKFKLSKAEQEIGTMEQNINRLEGQVSRYKASADNSEKIEDELKAEKRKLQRELRTALDKIEEMEMTNNHLVKRLEKMKANRNALLSQQ
ncbi:Leucine-rich repeat flightless-interacting protein 2 [Takifugu flavidus]|uniref:Leucine-rich repeat flightless-interacting protein 2 n=1 Tax=Takifugu flavidus TaxID=433684 RepID=A0A5C6PFH7_9TELE|nr:Leucine-rich repeat flightless-interacting protein 2 [Takifugu flavidus]